MLTPAEEQITQLYAGYLDRAADHGGFNFWLSQANSGASLLGIADSFSQTPEYLSIYGGLGNQTLINTIYANMFDREPDAGGNAYWMAQLESGVSSAHLIVNMISGAQGDDRIKLENTAIVSRDWTVSTAHLPFTLEAAQNALDSIGKIEGNGVTVTLGYGGDTLLPYLDQLTADMTAAWKQWGDHGRLDVKLNFLDLGNNTLAFAYAENELRTGQANQYGIPITQTNVGMEINTGKDMNGDLPDISITIAMNLPQFSLYDRIYIFAHEIGHGVGFRTELFDFDQDYSTVTSWDQYLTFPNGTKGQAYFNGPEAVALYGGPVPIVGYYNSTHTDGVGDIMDPTFGVGQVKLVGSLTDAMMHDIGVMV